MKRGPPEKKNLNEDIAIRWVQGKDVEMIAHAQASKRKN